MRQEPDDLVATYWRWMALSSSEQRKDRLLAERGDDAWAWDWVDQVVTAGQPEAVDLLQRLALGAPNDGALSRLGAGPLESLLNKHGPLLLDDLEEAIRRSSRLREALASVWYSAASPAVMERLGKLGLVAR